MARISFAAHPFLLGFEQIDRLLEKTVKSSNDGFPPYNIELSDDNNISSDWWKLFKDEKDSSQWQNTSNNY